MVHRLLGRVVTRLDPDWLNISVSDCRDQSNYWISRDQTQLLLTAE